MNSKAPNFSTSARAGNGDPQKIVVKCPGCQTALAVRRASASQVVKCPRCAKHLRVGPPKPKQTTAPRAAKSKPSAARVPARHAASTDPALDRAFDPIWDSLPLDAPAPTFQAPASTFPLHAKPLASNPSHFVKNCLLWMNGHRWITIIAALNLIFIVLSLALGQAAGIGSVAAGAVLIGLLQVPRQHIIERMLDSFGSAIANMTVGTVIFGTILGIVRIALRLGRREQPIDFSQWPMVLASVGVALGVIVVFLILWHHFGLFRLLAGLYVAQLGLAIISMVMVFRWEGIIQEQAQNRALAGAERRLEKRNERRFREPRRQASEGEPRLNPARVPLPSERLSGKELWQAKRQGELRVAFRFDPDDPDMRPEPRMAAVLAGRVGTPQWDHRGEPGNLILLVRYPGSAEEFASLIDFGTVTRLDKESREIDVELGPLP